jgi:putative chitinase
MLVTLEQLERLFESTKRETLQKYVDPLNDALEKYEINTPKRIAMFMAQIGHESGGLTIVEESLNYRAERLKVVFPKYFNNVDPNEYAHNPQKIGNRVYANRMGNGSEQSGDGYKYRGRGFIQLTGHDNYASYAHAAGFQSVDEAVAYLSTPEGACSSAAWFWSAHGLNAFADADDCLGATKRINGGVIGLAEREAIYKEALEIFC